MTLFTQWIIAMTGTYWDLSKPYSSVQFSSDTLSFSVHTCTSNEIYLHIAQHRIRYKNSSKTKWRTIWFMIMIHPEIRNVTHTKPQSQPPQTLYTEVMSSASLLWILWFEWPEEEFIMNSNYTYWGVFKVILISLRHKGVEFYRKYN